MLAVDSSKQQVLASGSTNGASTEKYENMVLPRLTSSVHNDAEDEDEEKGKIYVQFVSKSTKMGMKSVGRIASFVHMCFIANAYSNGL